MTKNGTVLIDKNVMVHFSTIAAIVFKVNEIILIQQWG